MRPILVHTWASVQASERAMSTRTHSWSLGHPKTPWANSGEAKVAKTPGIDQFTWLKDFDLDLLKTPGTNTQSCQNDGLYSGKIKIHLKQTQVDEENIRKP